MLREPGLRCPKCSSGFRTLETRPQPGVGTRRRKICTYCGHRSTTIEIIIPDRAFKKGLFEENPALIPVRQLMEKINGN